MEHNSYRHPANRKALLLLIIAILMIAVGIYLAVWTQTRDGVTVSDVRFRAKDGTVFSAYLYRPPGSDATKPVPGILAIHGYINTRETQSAFAIEFARRGYVVLALDQRGHGYSQGAATTKGFGGPEGLSYLRSLPFVDRNQIGLEGHSMGGWAVLAAAAANPDGYRAMVLEGSSTGAPFAREGTAKWPRNVAVVYSRFDEFAPLMWGVDRGADVGRSAKLQTLFGSSSPVKTGVLYGDISAGTARILRTPFATHPGDHISEGAVGNATDWFAQTLRGGTPRANSDQIWWIKEAGTGIALLGLAVLTFALFDLLLNVAIFAPLLNASEIISQQRQRKWWLLWLLTAFVPAITFYMALLVAPPPILPNAVFPQAVTNWLMVWALVNIVLALVFGRLMRDDVVRIVPVNWVRSVLLAATVIVFLYLVVMIAGVLRVDFRFWVVAVKPMSAGQALAFLAYLAPFTLFVLVAFRGVTRLMAHTNHIFVQHCIACGALASGFFILTGVQYVVLFATGRLPVALEALNVIVAIQFVPLLAGLGVLAVYTIRRTGSYLPGGLVGGLFITWYMVAGTATHYAL